ncbi:MAG: protein phosphatase 2C domain-containing protein [Pyrinomonadaceae bacterium]
MQNNIEIVSASVSDRGLSEKRPENEDSFLEIKASGIYAVADGVGGAQAGDVASQMAIEIVGEAFINMKSTGDAEETMKVAIERANEAIFQMSNELPQLSTMATTIVALQIKDNIATIGHVGDSRLYRIDGNGTLFRETQDHSVVEEEVRAGRMTPEQAANHPSRNIISRALGAEPTVKVDLKTIMFEPNTTFLICSDGITRHITDDEINALLFSANQPASICQRMKEICYDRGAEDNLTAVIVRALESAEDVQTAAADFEEDTIATARPPLAASAGFSNSGSFEQQSTPQNFAVENYETQKLQTENSPEVPAEQSVMENISSANIATQVNETENNRTVISYESEKDGSGILGKLFGGLALLLLGIVIGAIGYQLIAKPEIVERPIVIEQPAETNIQSDSFLTLVEGVDENPENVIKATQNVANSAEEFYLLGRAYLLQKNYQEAKKNFTEAKNRLATADKENAKILATEIALGLAVINGQFSLREFEKELPAATTENTNTNSSAGNSTNALTPPNG